MYEIQTFAEDYHSIIHTGTGIILCSCDKLEKAELILAALMESGRNYR